MEQVCEVIVGSHLHGLATKESDTDYKGVHMSTLREKLSVFKTVPKRQSLRTKDDVSFELDWFISLCSKGNPTVLEVLFSDLVVHSSPTFRELKDNWKKVFNTEKYVAACLGYARTQHHKAQNKGFERQGKLAVAEIRVLLQCIAFLETGEFVCEAPDNYSTVLLDFKTRGKEVTIQELEFYTNPLNEEIAIMEPSAVLQLTPDHEWMDDFVYRSYTA